MTDETKKHGPDDVVDISLAADAAADAAVEADTPSEPDPLDVLRTENSDLRDKYLRLAAEMDNLRRRTERDVKDAKSYSVAGFARDMLAVSDNLRRALDAVADVEQAENSPINALIEGVQLTMRDLLNTFSRHGMKPLAPQAGDAFDPLLHEAMFEAPLPGTKAGDIIQVMTEGFLLHDRLLRPAQVGVSSTPKS